MLPQILCDTGWALTFSAIPFDRGASYQKNDGQGRENQKLVLLRTSITFDLGIGYGSNFGNPNFRLCAFIPFILERTYPNNKN